MISWWVSSVSEQGVKITNRQNVWVSTHPLLLLLLLWDLPTRLSKPHKTAFCNCFYYTINLLINFCHFKTRLFKFLILWTDGQTEQKDQYHVLLWSTFCPAEQTEVLNDFVNKLCLLSKHPAFSYDLLLCPFTIKKKI